MIFRQFFTPGLAIYSYLLGDKTTGSACLIDPTRNVEQYLRAAAEEGVEIKAILETHVHADFVSGAKELKHALGGKARIYASKMGGEEWLPRYVDSPVAHQDEICLNPEWSLEALHTPGHTPEHLVWVYYENKDHQKIPRLLFSGDLLFIGAVGRPDLLGKEELHTLSKNLYHSLFETLATLPDHLLLYPAHGAGSFCGKGMSSSSSSTLGQERRFNPSLQKKPEKVWIENLLYQMPVAPYHFQKIKRINVEGPELLSTLHSQLLEQKNLPKASVLIDLRHPIRFAEGHFSQALNIPYGSSFANWASMVVPDEQSIFLIADKREQVADIQKSLQLMGFDLFSGFMLWEKRDRDLPLERLDVLTPNFIDQTRLTLLDVRTEAEWHMGHIEGATHVELARLPLVIKELSPSEPIACICGSGYRSSVAASFLRLKGIDQVSTVWGGMQEWQRLGLPINVKKNEE